MGKNSVAARVREHNRLNGFVFVIAEFLLVILAALFISASGLLHNRILLAMTGVGIAANAGAVIVIAAAQIRAHEQSEGLLKVRSPEFRAMLRQNNPNLSTHTLIVFVSTLLPFLLVVLLILQVRTNTRRIR